MKRLLLVFVFIFAIILVGCIGNEASFAKFTDPTYCDSDSDCKIYTFASHCNRTVANTFANLIEPPKCTEACGYSSLLPCKWNNMVPFCNNNKCDVKTDCSSVREEILESQMDCESLEPRYELAEGRNFGHWSRICRLFEECER